MKKILILVLFYLALLTPLKDLSAQSSDIIFSMNCASSSDTNCGWPGSVPENAHHSRTFLQGGGPNGQNAMRFNYLNSGGYDEFYLGWSGFIEQENLPQGSTRYYRFRLRYTPETIFNGYNSSGGTGRMLNKYLIVGDGCGSNCRPILQAYTYDMTGNFRVTLQIDGGAYPITVDNLTAGVWYDIQLELNTSSSTSNPNGSYKMWVNNNNYSSPSAQTSGFQLNPVRWGYVAFGFYSNHVVTSQGQVGMILTDFQAARSFNSNWYGGGSTTPPPPTVTVPTAPASLSASPAGTSQVNLSWTDSSNNETGFRIERKTGSAGTYAEIATVGANTTTYQNTGLTASTQYYYRVRAYNSAGNSSYSVESIAVTSNPTTVSPSTRFTVGQRVQTTANVNVRSTASATGALLGTQALGALGTIVSGGTSVDGYYWWNVNFDSGVDGWSVETFLNPYTAPATPTPTTSGVFFNEGWESGSKANSFNSSGYGNLLNSTQYSVQTSTRSTGSYGLRHGLTTGMTGGDAQYATQHFGDSVTGPVVSGTAGNTYSDVYAQWKVFYSPGFNFAVNPKQVIFGTQDSRRHDNSCCNPWVSHYMLINSYGGYFQAEGNNKQGASGQWLNIGLNQSGYSGSNRYAIQSGRWYTIEVRRRLNDANQDNGVFEMWIDGTLVARHSNVRWRVPWTGTFGDDFTRGTNFFMISDYLTDGIPVPANQEIYYDDVKLSTSYIGTSGTTTPTPPPPVTPTADIRANNSTSPISIVSGSSATISWASTNTTTCSVSPSSWTGTSGSQSTGALTASRTYTISCTGSGGTVTDSISVNVTPPPDTTPPAVSVSSPVSGSTVSGTVTVSANASDNIGVAGVQFRLNGVNLGIEDTTSPYSVSWNTTTATNGIHTLTAVARDAAGNTTTSSAVSVTVNNVTVTPAPTVTISASPTSVTVGSSSTLSWSSTNATSCTASGAWSGSRGTSGTMSVSPTTSSTYTLSCTGAGGTVTQSTTVFVETNTQVTTNPGTVTTLSVSQTNTTSVTLSFVEVNDGTGLPSQYDVRFASPTLSWGSAGSVTSGTCSTPLQGTTIGGTKTCTVDNLNPGTQYGFQLVSFRGTLNQNAVFGGLSNKVTTTTLTTTAPPPPPPTETLPSLDIMEPKVGDRVQTTTRVSVRETPGGDRIGSQPRNSKGTVIEGPIEGGSHLWYKVDYDSGVDGWSSATYLTKVSVTAMTEDEIRNSIANIFLLINQLQEQLNKMKIN